MTEIIIKLKRIPEGVFRKYTKEEMVLRLLQKHPELVKEVFDKSYFIDDEKEAAEFLVNCFINNSLDIDTLESDEERKKHQPEDINDTNKSLWDRISEKI